jgi:hypothetical protein
MDDMRRDDRVRSWIDPREHDYRNREHDVLVRYSDRYTHDRDLYRDRYRPWWNEGFYGGCYWEFHPVLDIDTYFYDPVVYWFYESDADDYYYRTWYGSDYDRYPELHSGFKYVGVFYPTEEFRDLNLGISALGVEVQARYRRASIVLGDRIDSEFRRRGGHALGENDVVIDHYQILPDDQGVVVEGFVDQDNQEFAFKSVLDLSNPDNTMVFSVSADETPSDDELDQLRQVNTRIEDLGGVAEGATSDDVTTPDQNQGQDQGQVPANGDGSSTGNSSNDDGGLYGNDQSSDS